MSDPGRADALATMSRIVARDVRRVASAVCVVGLLAVAWAVPLSRQDVIDSATFSIAFFATLLTGEAVIFALSFSASSAWPSFREIDGHIGFRDWVVTGWLGAMLTASGLLAQAATAATYGAFLFLLADLVRDILLHPAARAGQLGRAQAAAGADPRQGTARSGAGCAAAAGRRGRRRRLPRPAGPVRVRQRRRQRAGSCRRARQRDRG